MKIDVLEEPELEFGAGRHIDIRFGIMDYGPLDVLAELAPKQIRVGIVGTPDGVEMVADWLERCRSEIPPKTSRQPNLFPRFPGFSPDVAFRSSLLLDESLRRIIPIRVFEGLKRSGDANRIVREAADHFVAEFEDLQANTAADVFVCAVPPQVAELMDPANRPGGGGATRPLNFRHLTKARSLPLKPVQLILPSTADPRRARKLKIRKNETRSVQDDATRAWNFFTALYYKAHGRPWRLPRDPSQLSTCYVGISFYQSLDLKTIMTSMAQVFDERGDGVVVRGGPVRVTKDDRVPRLTEGDAESLLREALTRYRRMHQHFPARLVVHKTSSFSAAEFAGFRAAAEAASIDTVDHLSVTEESTQRLFRYGAYPPLRGTHLSLDARDQLLYTKGSVDFYATYPGMYVPRPLLFRCEQVEQTPKFLAREMLALTKMNWNDTQFDGALPITLVAARRVGDILKYVPADGSIADRYAHYM